MGAVAPVWWTLTAEQRNRIKRSELALWVDPAGFVHAKDPGGREAVADTPRRAVDSLASPKPPAV